MSQLELYTIRGGANDGLQIWYLAHIHGTHTWLGADRYTVRDHDRILLLSPASDASSDAHKDHAAMKARTEQVTP